MLKKEFLAAGIVFLFIGGTAVASQSTNNHREENPGHALVKAAKHIPTPTSSITPTVTPTIVCDANSHWDSHGAYVSCVANLHLGGNITSRAAHTEIGKTDNDNDGNDDKDDDHRNKNEPKPTKTPKPIQRPDDN